MKITTNMKKYADRRDMELEFVERDEDFECDVLRVWHFYEEDMADPIVQFRINEDGSLGFLPFSDQKGEDWPAHIKEDDWDTLKRVINYAQELTK